MLTYLRGLNRSSMSEPELLFYFTDWGIKCPPRTYLCRYSKWRLTHSVSFYTELVPWPTDSTEHVPRPHTHTHTHRGITAHLSCSHTPCCCIPNKQEEGVERAIDCDWVGTPWRGLPTSNSTAFLLCLSAAASYYPSNFPSPLPGLLMHPIIGASHDYGNGSYCNPAFFPDTSIQAMIVKHKRNGGFKTIHFQYTWTFNRDVTLWARNWLFLLLFWLVSVHLNI